MSNQSSQANDALDNNRHSRITTLSEVGLSLGICFAHYRHAPLQAGAILLGIVLAVTLLIGVKSTNENAVRSYTEATELLSQRASLLITPNAGEQIGRAHV